MELVPYIPEIATYKIFHPENFILNDEEGSGIVTITSPEGQNMTLSSYSASVDMTEDVLLSFFQDLTQKYNSTSELRSVTAGHYLSCEQHFTKDENYWIWWLYAKSKQIIAVSVNSETELNEEEYNLFRFMADNMEIFDEEENAD